jgi:hypothetical protein
VGVRGVWGVWGVVVWGHSLRSTFHRLHLLRLWTPTIFIFIKLYMQCNAMVWHRLTLFNNSGTFDIYQFRLFYRQNSNFISLMAIVDNVHRYVVWCHQQGHDGASIGEEIIAENRRNCALYQLWFEGVHLRWIPSRVTYHPTTCTVLVVTVYYIQRKLCEMREESHALPSIHFGFQWDLKTGNRCFIKLLQLTLHSVL